MKFTLCSLILCFFLQSKAQDNLVNYNNPSEKKLFSTQSNYKDLFKLALVSQVSERDADEYQKRVDDFIVEINWIPSARPDKKLKNLFDGIHSRFLKKYDEKASFEEIFISGTYQCVNASLLFSYILQTLDIPYQIKELPTHVYVVAYPESYNIMIETTDPTQGFFVPSDKEKKSYVEMLIQNKYLEQEYVNRVGVEKAYNDVFYGKTNLSFIETVGLLYYNRCLKNEDDKNYKSAFSNISKANILYPSKKHEFLQSGLLNEVVRNLDLNYVKDWEAVIALVNLANIHNNKNHLLFKFNESIDKYLVKASLKNKLDSIYSYLSVNIKDSILKTEVKELYLQEVGRSLYLSGKLEEGRPYFEQAVKFNPNNNLTKSLLVEYILRRSLSSSASLSNTQKLDNWVREYNTIKTDSRIRTAYLLHYIYLGNKAFQLKQTINGLKYYQLMVNELQSSVEFENLPEDDMANLFMESCGVFLSKNQKSKASEALSLGCKFCPNNKMLKDMAKMKKTLFNIDFSNLPN